MLEAQTCGPVFRPDGCSTPPGRTDAAQAARDHDLGVMRCNCTSRRLPSRPRSRGHRMADLPQRGAVGRFWASTDSRVRRLTCFCLPLGFFLIGVGWYGDQHCWWNNRAFLTNLLSSFTSLMFGVPLALVVLSRITSGQAEALARAAALEQAREAAVQFRSTLLAQSSRPTPQQLALVCKALTRPAADSATRRSQRNQASIERSTQNAWQEPWRRSTKPSSKC
ncbi:hypothetical protein FBY35_0065 [Streptomyces sp. SLBN-118]|nr:hypothetical protein FBY35_0065 [Streptomyces sp. SLBN-118]